MTMQQIRINIFSFYSLANLFMRGMKRKFILHESE